MLGKRVDCIVHVMIKKGSIRFNWKCTMMLGEKGCIRCTFYSVHWEGVIYTRRKVKYTLYTAVYNKKAERVLYTRRKCQNTRCIVLHNRKARRVLFTVY